MSKYLRDLDYGLQIVAPVIIIIIIIINKASGEGRQHNAASSPKAEVPDSVHIRPKKQRHTKLGFPSH